MGGIVVWQGTIARPFPARGRAILEQLGSVTFWCRPIRAGHGHGLWVRLHTVPQEYVEYCAVRLLVDAELFEVPHA